MSNIFPSLWIDENKLNYLEINNLEQIIKLKFKYICLSSNDFFQITAVPKIEKEFYPFHDRLHYNKKGFFYGGKTMCWVSYILKCGEIKIASKLPTNGECDVWSDVFNFKEIDSPMKIYKTMKMKAFW